MAGQGELEERLRGFYGAWGRSSGDVRICEIAAELAGNKDAQDAFNSKLRSRYFCTDLASSQV